MRWRVMAGTLALALGLRALARGWRFFILALDLTGLMRYNRDSINLNERIICELSTRK